MPVICYKCVINIFYQELDMQLPNGELVLRTLAMPADTNANGDIFGGWLMSQMDIGGAILAKELALGRVVTVAVNGIKFQKPVAVGDVVCCYARCLKTGKSSITINIEVWVKKVATQPVGHRYRATDAIFTYVAVNDDSTARELPKDKQHFQFESSERNTTSD